MEQQQSSQCLSQSCCSTALQAPPPLRVPQAEAGARAKATAASQQDTSTDRATAMTQMLHWWLVGWVVDEHIIHHYCTEGNFTSLSYSGEKSLCKLSLHKALNICICNLILKSDGRDGKLQVILCHSVNLRDHWLYLIVLFPTVCLMSLTDSGVK